MNTLTHRFGSLALAAAPLPLILGACGAESTAEAAAAAASAGDATDSEKTDMSSAPALPESSVYRLSAKTLAGEELDLAAHSGKVTLFVNVASQCGFTRQYADLQELHEELGGETFAIVGIPSNDFGQQEPGTADEIARFCREDYGVTFQMLEKQSTKEGASPLFDQLAALTEGSRPTWNFCKYVVSADGARARFFESAALPGGDEIRSAIAELNM
ncbi:MAG: glutathione peroxidase [Planctomycetota bacterium]